MMNWINLQINLLKITDFHYNVIANLHQMSNYCKNLNKGYKDALKENYKKF